MSPSKQTLAPQTHARVAGLLYLVIIVCGIGSEALVRGPLVVAGDAGRTAANLMAAELPFRLSILADVVMALSDVALAALLFFLLKPVSHALSLMAMAFRLVQAAILGLNLLNLHNAAALLNDKAFDLGQRDALVMTFLNAHATGYDFGLFFFGINCLLVGVLVFRAGFFPRVVGVMMSAAGVVYLVGSTIRLVAPGLVEAVAPAYLIPLLAELAFCSWLVVKGLDVEKWLSASQRAKCSSLDRTNSPERGVHQEHAALAHAKSPELRDHLTDANFIHGDHLAPYSSYFVPGSPSPESKRGLG